MSLRTAMFSSMLALLAGCGESRQLYEYEYDSVYTKDIPVRDGITAKAPIAITLRLEKKGNSLSIRTKLVDAMGTTEFGTETLDCSIFDQENFNCERPDGHERVAMKDGELSIFHDGEQLIWKRHVRIMGHRVF
jgi:hypothetical protein